MAYPFFIGCIVLNELGLSSLAHSLAYAGNEVLATFLEYLTQLAVIPGNLWTVDARVLLPAALLSSLLLLSYSLGPASLRKKGFSVLFIALLILFRISFRISLTESALPRQDQSTSSQPLIAEPTATQVEQLDVGQGDAALVFGGPRKIGLIDTGSEKSLSDDQWIQIFAERQVHEISWIALTHLDEDHAGGLKRLSRLIPIHCAVTPFEELSTERGNSYQEALPGVRLRSWSSGCVPYPSLTLQPSTPLRSPKGHAHSTRNSNMGVVWVPLSEGGFYLSAGDAGASDEARLIEWVTRLSHASSEKSSDSRILKISHHGSRYSSQIEFLKAVRPTEAWISVGIGNRYGHPSAQTLELLEALKIPVKRTDRDGAIFSETKEAAFRRPLRKHPQ